MTMAKVTPVAVTHQGVSGGSVKAINTAVTSALKSSRYGRKGSPRNLSIAASAASATPPAMTILNISPGPKK